MRRRGGAIAFYKWGSLGQNYTSDHNPGQIRKFPEGGHASLDSIRGGLWRQFEPRPARIVASRFVQVNVHQVPCYFELKPGEFIQGLIASIGFHERLYVVTVAPPAEHTGEWQDWPRIVKHANAK